MNGAKACTSKLGQFFCDCATDFTGLACETRIDDCASNPCLNGATCQDGNEDFTCLCPANFTGKLCDRCDIENCAECSLPEIGVCLQCLPNYRLDEDGTCGKFSGLAFQSVHADNVLNKSLRQYTHVASCVFVSAPNNARHYIHVLSVSHQAYRCSCIYTLRNLYKLLLRLSFFSLRPQLSKWWNTEIRL